MFDLAPWAPLAADWMAPPSRAWHLPVSGRWWLPDCWQLAFFWKDLFAYFVPADNWLPTKCLIWPIIWEFHQWIFISFLSHLKWFNCFLFNLWPALEFVHSTWSDKRKLALIDDDVPAFLLYCRQLTQNIYPYFVFFLMKKRTHCIEYSKNKTNLHITSDWFYEWMI